MDLLDAILIRQVELPQTLRDAIECKLKEEQSSLEYEYRLEKERKEAGRILIEANGKAKANLVLHASLTDKILTDKGIEATLSTCGFTQYQGDLSGWWQGWIAADLE